MFGLIAELHKAFHWVVTKAAECGWKMREREESFGACWYFDSIPNFGQNKTSDRLSCGEVMGL